MAMDELSYKIRGAIFNVYNELGPGLFESAYSQALYFELIEMGLKVEKEVSFPVIYKGIILDTSFRADLVIENQIIIELKSVDELSPKHKKQLINYLCLSGIKLGILVNFNESNLKNGIKRIVNQF